MTVEEFYKKINADYQDVIKRLANKQIVDRIVVKFKEDKTFNNLQEARSIYIVVQTEEARYKAENGIEAKTALTDTNFYTNTGVGLVGTAKKKTELDVTEIKYDAAKKAYTLKWTSDDGKAITGTLTTNKDVKISHS